MFLSKAERDYLIADFTTNKFNPGYDRVIRSRLNKKIQQFVNQELPLLMEKGYVNVTEFRDSSVTENRNMPMSITTEGFKPTRPFGHGGEHSNDIYTSSTSENNCGGRLAWQGVGLLIPCPKGRVGSNFRARTERKSHSPRFLLLFFSHYYHHYHLDHYALPGCSLLLFFLIRISD